MKKRTILVMALVLMLLPIFTPSTQATYAETDYTPIDDEYTPDVVGPGSKFIYDITTFDLGAGFDDLLQELNDDPESPDFDIGFSGTLEGSEIWAYIMYEDLLDLYEYDYDTSTYENHTQKNALQVISTLYLNSDIAGYANLSQISYPEDALIQTESYYYDSWPMSGFDDSIESTVFWNAFETAFIDSFNWGFDDEVNENWYWPWFNWPDPDWYDSDEIEYFAQDLGTMFGYDVGRDAGSRAKDANPGDPYSTSWNDANSAFNAYKIGFLESRDDAYNAGKDDYVNNNRIPNVQFTNPYDPVSTIVELGKQHGYDDAYHPYYEAGFFYEGAQEYYERELYWELYQNKWETYASGYLEGYRDAYQYGYQDGEYDNNIGIYGDSYEIPEWLMYYDPDNSREHGYNDGVETGYNDAYEAGWTDGYGDDTEYNEDQEFIWGMENYIYESYEDGFHDGANDYIGGFGYDNGSYTLPYGSPSNSYEEGANFIYGMQYPKAYDNGWKYAWLTDRNGNDLNWLMHEGPFYYMMLPDFVMNIQSGSALPFPVDMTMFTELNISLMDYEFNYMHDYGPFSENFAPFSIYAPDSDWTELDTYDWAFDPNEDGPGIATTIAGDIFEIIFDWEDTDAEILLDLTLQYNMTSGKLVYIEFNFDAYTQTDMTFTIVVEYNSDVEITMPTPSPTSWSYLVDTFDLDYNLPPEAPTDFTDDLDEVATEGAAAEGNPFADVTFNGRDGLYNNFTMEAYNPNNVSETTGPATEMIPALTPNFQLLPDWELWDGLMTTGDSFLSYFEWVDQALGMLSDINTNVAFYKHDLTPVMDTYHDTGTDIMYMYASLTGAFEFSVSFLNGDFEWETVGGSIYFKVVAWLAYDHTTGVLVGGGLEGTVDAVLTIPDAPFAPESTFYFDLNIRFRSDQLASLDSITDIKAFAEIPGKDTEDPVINSITYTPESPKDDDVITITADVNDSSGIDEVILSYRNNSGPWQNITMTQQPSGNFTVDIGPFEKNTEIDFYIIATDYTYPGNVIESLVYTVEIKGGILGIGYSFVDFMLMSLGLLSLATLFGLYKRKK